MKQFRTPLTNEKSSWEFTKLHYHMGPWFLMPRVREQFPQFRSRNLRHVSHARALILEDEPRFCFGASGGAQSVFWVLGFGGLGFWDVSGLGSKV